MSFFLVFLVDVRVNFSRCSSIADVRFCLGFVFQIVILVLDGSGRLVTEPVSSVLAHHRLRKTRFFC